MRAHLPDVNVLIALMDPNHVFHEPAHEWWSRRGAVPWASCPLTENGVVRILSQPAYSPTLPLSPVQVLQLLREFIRHTDHRFWTDSITLTDGNLFEARFLIGSRQMTDAYLLALAVQNEGCLVTFDQAIQTSWVRGAGSEHLLVL